MASKKRNEFLDADDSEKDSDQGYDSETDDIRKGGRSPKRRRVEDRSDEEDDDIEEDADDAPPDEVIELKEQEDGNQTKQAIKLQKSLKALELSGISRPLTKKNFVATEKAIKRSGVVYLSRIPPFMKPTKLRSLLEPYGAINRIFMTPEDPTSHALRVRNGGNKKRSFNDGWVEFVNKAEAKEACELLNTNIIGGKKGTFYHDDVWNLLYLKGFKWHNLTEQISAENAERASRMRAEISKTTRENKEFVRNVDRAKKLDGMESKRAAKRWKDGDAQVATIAEPRTNIKSGDRPLHIKQNAVAIKKRPADQPEEVKRVLSKIF